MIRSEMITKYNFENATFTARELDEIVHDINESNRWNIDKFISFDVVTRDIYKINFWDNDENIEFVRVDASNQFKAVL